MKTTVIIFAGTLFLQRPRATVSLVPLNPYVFIYNIVALLTFIQHFIDNNPSKAIIYYVNYVYICIRIIIFHDRRKYLRDEIKIHEYDSREWV